MKKWLCPLLVAGKVSQIVSHRKGRFRYEDRPIHKGCIERHGSMSGVHRLHSGQLATMKAEAGIMGSNEMISAGARQQAVWHLRDGKIRLCFIEGTLKPKC